MDEPDYFDEDDEGGSDLDDCGAYGEGTMVQQWQRCQLAGTEYCDWECSFARAVRAELDRDARNG